MSACLQSIWLISIFAMIFFLFLGVSMITAGEYLPFESNTQSINVCCIVFMMYSIVFLVSSCILYCKKTVKRHADTQQVPSGERMKPEDDVELRESINQNKPSLEGHSSAADIIHDYD